MQALTTLLPVLWAAVATAIGLALYRTSAAFYRSTKKGASGTRTIRATGSVVIAGIAFAGMWYATPIEALRPRDPHIEEVLRISDQIDRAALEMDACDSMNCSQACAGETAELRRLTSDLKKAARRASGAGGD